MESFRQLIKIYQNSIVLAESTKHNYVKCLDEFNEFLSQKLNCNPNEVDLEKIYVIMRPNNDVFSYKPISHKLIDEFLFSKVGCGYSKLSRFSFSIKSFFRYLNTNKNFPDVTIDMKFDLKKYKIRKKPIRILSRHEILKFFNSLIMHSEDLFKEVLLFSLLFSTGCRVSEILNLKVYDIDLNAELFVLEKTKNKNPRVVSLREGFGEAIGKYCTSQQRGDSDFLFTIDERPITPQKLNFIFKKYLRLAGLPLVRVHSMRHSFATHMLESGSNILFIQQILGHESLSSTRVYTHPNYTRNKGIKIKEHDMVYSGISSVLENVISNKNK